MKLGSVPPKRSSLRLTFWFGLSHVVGGFGGAFLNFVFSVLGKASQYNHYPRIASKIYQHPLEPDSCTDLALFFGKSRECNDIFA